MRTGTAREILAYIDSVERSLRGGVTEPTETWPFVAYVQDRIARLEESWRRLGLDVRAMSYHGASALHEVLAGFGWSDPKGTGYRHWYEFSHGQAVCSRHLIENALWHAGIPFADIYPDEAVDVELLPDEPCPTCRLDVTPLPLRGGRICPWCDTWLAGPVKVRSRPACTAISAKTGLPCGRPPKAGSAICPAHDPLNLEANRVRLQQHRNSHFLPAEPLAAWLRDLVAARGGYAAAASQLATSGQVVRDICAGGQRSVTPRVAERMLSAHRRRNPGDATPALKQLWPDRAGSERTTA